VVQGVGQDVNPDSLPLPDEEAAKIVARLNAHKEELMENMRIFNKILNDSTLSENKSIKDREYEQSVVNKLAQSAMEVEKYSAGSGLLGLCVLALRQAISLRDAGNSVAYRLFQLEEEIKKSNNTGEADKAGKQYLEELAKKLGLEISIKE
jgi:hypothetical protein